MAAQQTSVSESPAIGFAGQLADTSNKRSLSKYNQKPLHGEIRMRIGAEFLRGYQ